MKVAPSLFLEFSGSPSTLEEQAKIVGMLFVPLSGNVGKQKIINMEKQLM